MSQKKKSALTAGIGYTVGNILVKGINFLTLPLFSRLMSTEEFGVYNVFLSYDAILFVLIGFALHSSIRSADITFRGKIDEYTSSITLIYLQNALILLATVLLFGSFFSRLLSFERSILVLLILFSTGTAILTLYNERISLDYSYKQYLVVALVNSVGNVLLSLALILTAFRSRRDLGRIFGTALTTVGLMIFLLAALYRKARPRYHREYWRFGLRYSLPIVPHGISQVLLAQFDRIMIRDMVSDSAAGIYSLAGNLKLILTVITTSVSTAWSTWFYGEMIKGEPSSIRRRAVQLSCLFTIFTVGVMALAPELIFFLGGTEYDAGKYVAIPMALDGFILFLYNIIVVGEYYTQKTVFIMLGTMTAAGLNLVLNYVFILRYGFIAAAYTTLFAYVCYLILHLIISRRAVGFAILPVKWLLIFSAVAVVMAAMDLVLIRSLVLRWLLCAAVVIPMTFLLLKDVGGFTSLRRGGNPENDKENAQ
ncbi:MAG: oligosaccharide flippase family protein [Oscillospiraceae bacterium]|nr:oligosaccharide flippase family protein [Oscillospiraceae bacterium]